MLTPARLELRDPIARLAYGFTQFLEKGSSDDVWARLVVQSSRSPTEFGRGVRENLKADLAEAIADGRLTVSDIELAAGHDEAIVFVHGYNNTFAEGLYRQTPRTSGCRRRR